jgi:3-oxoacyl-[acyl-carrier protein] reductase
MMAGRLYEKVAIVTGAGRGIGRAIAIRLADEGASVVVNYSRSREAASEVVETIRSRSGKAVALQADVGRRSEVIRLFQDIDRELGRLDIVVNSAGVSSATPLADLDEGTMEKLLAVNLRGPVYIASEAAKRLPAGGRIVNISSSLVEFPFAGSSIYTATKAAVKAFTDVWAKELGSKGITVNTIIPGPTSPGMMDTAPESFREVYAKASPFARIGRAEEIAAVVAFLCSPEASWVSGAHILANGAATA